MKRLWLILIVGGSASILLGICILVLAFYPVIKIELAYDFSSHQPVSVELTGAKSLASNVISPVDAKFGIVIPKIRANAQIIPQVDPFNSAIYQVALTKGVAQAKGTAFPGEGGNMFLFSHSSVNFYDALKYNSIFYLLTKLEKGDEIDVFYHAKKYTYHVDGKKIVDPKDVSYLTHMTNRPTITLMTCWPPGTSINRLLVFGSLSSN